MESNIKYIIFLSTNLREIIKDVLDKTYSEKGSVVLGDLSKKCSDMVIQIKDIETHLFVYDSIFIITQALCYVLSVPSVVMIWTQLPAQDWRPPDPICVTMLVSLPSAKDTVENVVSTMHKV